LIGCKFIFQMTYLVIFIFVLKFAVSINRSVYSYVKEMVFSIPSCLVNGNVVGVVVLAFCHISCSQPVISQMEY